MIQNCRITILLLAIVIIHSSDAYAYEIEAVNHAAIWLSEYGSAFVAIVAGIKILIALFMTLMGCLFGSGSGSQKFGKSIFALLGTLFSFWAANAFELLSSGSAKSSTVDFLLAPAPTSLMGHTLYWMVFAILMGIMIAATFGLFEYMADSSEVQFLYGVGAFIVSIAIAAFVPLCWALIGSQNIIACRLFDITLGIIFGGLSYVGIRLVLADSK